MFVFKVGDVLIDPLPIGRRILGTGPESGERARAVRRIERFDQGFSLGDTGGKTTGEGIAGTDGIDGQHWQNRDREDITVPAEDESIIPTPRQNERADPHVMKLSEDSGALFDHWRETE